MNKNNFEFYLWGIFLIKSLFFLLWCYWIRYWYLEEKLVKGFVWNFNGCIYLILIIFSIVFYWLLRLFVLDVCLFYGFWIYFDVLFLRYVLLNIFVVCIFWLFNFNVVLFFVLVECFFLLSVLKLKIKGIVLVNILECRKMFLSVIKSLN